MVENALEKASKRNLATPMRVPVSFGIAYFVIITYYNSNNQLINTILNYPMIAATTTPSLSSTSYDRMTSSSSSTSNTIASTPIEVTTLNPGI